METTWCSKCGGKCYFSAHCGAHVCMDCDHHKGLARCYCGWAASGGDGRRELVEMGETIDPEPEYVVSGVTRRYE
jgi:hypothetical protein